MAEARQASEWAQTGALLNGVLNVFRDAADQVDVLQFLPEHLRPAPAPAPTEEEVERNWDRLLGPVKRAAAKPGAPKPPTKPRKVNRAGGKRQRD